MLSTKKVTHYAIVKNLDGRGITKYPLSLSMYTDYRLAKNDRHIGDFIWITDLAGNKIREIDPIKFEEFEESHQDHTMDGAVYICDFGRRHPISEGGACNCHKEYDCYGFTFQDRLKAMGYKFDYPKQITREMKTGYKRTYLN